MPLFKFPENKKVNICVIGDIMLDHYINGSCDRISPEAPVQVVDVAADVYSLGGAGNVLKNLQAFGSKGSLISLSGNDDNNRIVDEELKKITPSFYYLGLDNNRRTTIKTRVVVNNHQLIRLDREDKIYCDDTVADDLVSFFKSKISQLDVVILSDYCKGALNDKLVKDVIALCNENNVITIADSKNKDLSKYRGVTLVKPNRKEASLASGINIVDDVTLEAACKKKLLMLQLVKNCCSNVVGGGDSYISPKQINKKANQSAGCFRCYRCRGHRYSCAGLCIG
jgi:rfaE bifunctional protein kinase chain/domain